MAVPYKICVDCVDPHLLAAFWAEALGYVIEDTSDLVRNLLANGAIPEAATKTVEGRLAFAEAAAIRDPDAPVDPRGVGLGGRMLFQVVPEKKTAKNRVHLDLHVGAERRDEVVAHLTELGGTVLWDGSEGRSTWITMADPEGNEFCVA